MRSSWGKDCRSELIRISACAAMLVFFAGCPGGTVGSSVRSDPPVFDESLNRTVYPDPPMTRVERDEVSDMLLAMEKARGAVQSEPFSCPKIEELPAATYSGKVGQRVAEAAKDMLGYEDRTRRAPDGLKCAVQVSNVLKRAGVEIPFDASVVGLVAKLKKAGWCSSATPVPGAIAYSNNEFGNGPRSHIGVVSYPADKIRSQVEERMGKLRQRFQFEGKQLTIYHNETRWIRGGPRGDYDRTWFSKVKFLVPPESCGGR